ncbi:MAG: DUF2723 domain-containing protein [Spirochaetia bacterium]|nr:DUF2723 domain-containing protein [Spirochaetia bacterium]
MNTDSRNRYSRITALAAVLLAVCYLYISTAHPVFKNNDSPETTAAAVCLGIGHPPGYPLYAMLGKIATLVPVANPAFRMNMLSVFLSVITLVLVYLTAGRLLSRQEGDADLGWRTEELIKWFTVMVLATSYIFWNQAIEAKGGIYILNLLFTAVVLFLFLLLQERFHIKYFYMISLISGLALANHWPSFILMVPAALWFCFARRDRLKPGRLFFMLLFFVAGLCAYLYLPIRARAEPLLNWGDPSNMASMLWVILRKAYAYPVKATPELFTYQLLEFLKFFLVNYGPLFLFVIAGAFAMWKKDRKAFRLLGYIVVIFFFMVVFYNRTRKDVIWLMHIFLMPAGYAMLFFIVPGVRFAAGALKSALYRNAVIAAALVFAGTACFINFRTNNNSRDFVSYDYGRNILRTLPQGALYMASGDYNAMPVYYAQEIEKLRRDVKFATDSFLIFKWGIDDLYRRTGEAISMTPYERENNIRNLIDHYADTSPIFRNYYWEQPVALDPEKYIEQQEGLLMKINRSRQRINSAVFDQYVYRGIFGGTSPNSPSNVALVTWYPACMVNAANALMEDDRVSEALALYMRALTFSVPKPEGNICYNVSLAYRRLNDSYNELVYLEKAASLKTTIPFVYERLGVVYYGLGLIDWAEEMLKRAVDMGQGGVAGKGLEIISKISPTDRNELALIKGSENLMAGNIQLAHKSYDFILEKGYKRDIILKNLGVYHFKTGDPQKALDYFLRSENETQDPGTEIYIIYAYDKLGEKDKARETAVKSARKYPQDKTLAELAGYLSGNGGYDGKDTGGADRQR